MRAAHACTGHTRERFIRTASAAPDAAGGTTEMPKEGCVNCWLRPGAFLSFAPCSPSGRRPVHMSEFVPRGPRHEIRGCKADADVDFGVPVVGSGWVDLARVLTVGLLRKSVARPLGSVVAFGCLGDRFVAPGCRGSGVCGA